MRAHRIEHDGNWVLEWGIGNVVGRYDARANVYLRKGPGRSRRSTPAVALIMAIARCMAGQPTRSVTRAAVCFSGCPLHGVKLLIEVAFRVAQLNELQLLIDVGLAKVELRGTIDPIDCGLTWIQRRRPC